MENNLVISRDVAERFPEAFVVTVHAQNLSSDHLETIAERTLASGSADACRGADGYGDVASIPAVAPWREAYRQAGVKPSKYRSSIEALIRRALRGDPLTVMPLVDLYNGISLRHGVPLGAVDSDLLPSGDIELRLCRPRSDHFEPLGGTPDDFPLLEGIPVYAIGSAVLCWCFNCRDARPTALRRATGRAIFFTEGTHADQLAQALLAMEDLASLLESCGSATTISVLKPK